MDQQETHQDDLEAHNVLKNEKKMYHKDRIKDKDKKRLISESKRLKLKN